MTGEGGPHDSEGGHCHTVNPRPFQVYLFIHHFDNHNNTATYTLKITRKKSLNSQYQFGQCMITAFRVHNVLGHNISLKKYHAVPVTRCVLLRI